MELKFKGSFRRDYKNINNAELMKALKGKIEEIRNAKNPNQIQNLKRLRTYETRSKIEIQITENRIYWILCTVTGNKIELIRVKTEQFFKKNLKPYKKWK